MKKLISCLLIAMILSAAAIAETYPPATSSPDREYTYDDFFSVVIRDGDLDTENVCGTIWAIMEGAIGEDDTLREVSLNNGVLTIKVDLTDAIPEFYTEGMYAQNRTSSIMDELFSYAELDEFWNKVHIVYQYAEATFTPDMAQGSGDRRYIDDPDIIAQIPD